MSFGLSFGSKKTKTRETTDFTQNQSGTQSGSELTSGSRTGTQSTSGTTTNTGTGTSTSTGTQNQSTASTGSQSQTGTTRSLSQNVLGGLEGAVTSLLSNILDPNTGDRAMLTRGVDAMGGFDLESFVNSNLMAARAQQGTQLDELIGSIFSRVGGTEGSNSASTLLAERARNDAAAQLAGVHAGATAAGHQILASNLGAATGAVGAMGQALLPALASILKGGETTTDVSTLTSELQNLLGTTTGTTATSESSGQTTGTTTTTTEDLVQAVLNALTQNTTTTGHAVTSGSNKETGGGLALSF